MSTDTKEPLSEARILDAAEDVLRRFGPRKTGVVDVARELGVSHGAVYRHFATKADLRDAVSARWLARISTPLKAIAADSAPAPQRLEAWLRALIHAKRAKVMDDAQMFDAYTALASESRAVIAAHVKHLVDQLTRIIADGLDEGTFDAACAHGAATAVFDATLRFHHPAHRHEWGDPAIDARVEGVLALIQRALAPGVGSVGTEP